MAEISLSEREYIKDIRQQFTLKNKVQQAIINAFIDGNGNGFFTELEPVRKQLRALMLRRVSPSMAERFLASEQIRLGLHNYGVGEFGTVCVMATIEFFNGAQTAYFAHQFSMHLHEALRILVAYLNAKIYPAGFHNALFNPNYYPNIVASFNWNCDSSIIEELTSSPKFPIYMDSPQLIPFPPPIPDDKPAHIPVQEVPEHLSPWQTPFPPVNDNKRASKYVQKVPEDLSPWQRALMPELLAQQQAQSTVVKEALDKQEPIGYNFIEIAKDKSGYYTAKYLKSCEQ